MKTRRQRKGGGIMGMARAAAGNVSNGGGRLTQFNLIINRVPNWRKFKRMLVLMGGGDVGDDKKWGDVHLRDDKKPDATDAAVAVPVAATNGGTRKNKRNRI
jgi:hypothetical protein